ncbi:MAG: hypothetical protein AB7N71_06060, partial [Phycisphaerae bacterium]
MSGTAIQTLNKRPQEIAFFTDLLPKRERFPKVGYAQEDGVQGNHLLQKTGEPSYLWYNRDST